MSGEPVRTCLGCDGELLPIVIMDYQHGRRLVGELEYRQADDARSFWTGRYPTAGPVQAFLCSDCGRIALFGQPSATTE
jgi:hypothetical protein